MAETVAFPPHVLREYALLADGERGALVGPRGDIAWLCAPRWHDDAVFSSLIGGAGTYGVTPRDPRNVWGGRYEDRSLIWRGRWVTSTGIIECREALAFPADPRRLVLLRRVQATAGDAQVDVRLHAAAGFGRQPAKDVTREGDVWTARAGPLYLRWTGGADADLEDGGLLSLRLDVPAGRHHDLVLEISDARLPRDPPNPDEA